MRLKLLPPDTLSAEQRPLFDEMVAGIERNLHGFVTKRDDGALAGPFNAMLHFPQFGASTWNVFTSLAKHSTLPKAAHEVAILVTGAQFKSRYEIYAHERVAAQAGLSSEKIATIVAGERPSDLTKEEASAYDVAAVLSRGSQLPETTYQAAVSAFGLDGMAELAYLIGCYCLVSVLLNAFDVSVPGREEGVG